MKPARAEVLADRDLKPSNVIDGVVVVRRQADPARRAKLVRLLSVLMDKPDTPEEVGPR